MGKLFNLNATNGECIVDVGDVSSRLRLHCVEELGDETIQSKRYVSIWIPVNKKGFWFMIKTVCDKMIESAGTGDNAKRELVEISNKVERLIRQLED